MEATREKGRKKERGISASAFTLPRSLDGDARSQEDVKMYGVCTHLINGVDGFHDPVLEELEVAELDRVVHAVVLEVLVVWRLGEVPAARHSVPVHVRDAAVAGGGVISCRPASPSDDVRVCGTECKRMNKRATVSMKVSARNAVDLTNSFGMQLDGAPLCSRKERANQVGNRHSFTRENHSQNVLRSPHRSFSHHYALQWRKSPMAHPTQLGKKPGRKEVR